MPQGRYGDTAGSGVTGPAVDDRPPSAYNAAVGFRRDDVGKRLRAVKRGCVHLIIQIPCYNEEDTLPVVLGSVPRSIPGVDRLEVLVVDDGSTDGTVEVARRLGVEHIVCHSGNRGLAAAFQTGIDACLALGADIIVNTDGDNQYPQADIPELVRPIVEGRADIVVGDRQTHTVAEFSRTKKALQALGSWTVARLSGLDIPDAPSGFRAYSREAAMRMNVVSKYTYTLETLIQAGAKRLRVEYVPVTTNPRLRESRLIKSSWGYVKRSAATLVRVYAMYEPLKVFSYAGIILCVIGGAGVARFVYFYLSGSGDGHVQSLVLAGALLVVGFQVLLIGLLADLVGANRRLLEETLYRLKRLELAGNRTEAAEKRSAGTDDLLVAAGSGRSDSER